MLKNYDYFPLEVKRTLQDKDFRHIMLFDWENPGRQLYCEKSGKALWCRELHIEKKLFKLKHIWIVHLKKLNFFHFK